MADIKDFYNAKNIVALWEQIKTANYQKPLAKWFPYRKTTEVDITLAYGYEKQNVALDLCAYDTNARIRGLQPISTAKMEMPFFKNSVLFTERQRREVMQTMTSPLRRRLPVTWRTSWTSCSMDRTSSVNDTALSFSNMVASSSRPRKATFPNRPFPSTTTSVASGRRTMWTTGRSALPKAPQTSLTTFSRLWTSTKRKTVRRLARGL